MKTLTNPFFKIINQLIYRPKKVFIQNSQKIHKFGIDEKIIILSFDCDSPSDAVASLKLSHWLQQNNIPAVFAVPGQTLLKNQKIYNKIPTNFFEFINHGYIEHVKYDDKQKRYVGHSWYHQMTDTEIKNDINKGHQTIIKKMGITPKCFRAPHFGLFQQPQQLDLIYQTINKLGYTGASTTIPKNAIKNGPIIKTKYSIYELPVTGCFDNPYIILDSWTFIASPIRQYSYSDYQNQFNKIINFHTTNNLPCLLGFYVDPSHIIDNPNFLQMLLNAKNSGFRFETYTGLVNSL